MAQLDAQQRAALAEQLGYRSIGAELPEDVSLGDVIQSMPKSVSPVPTEMQCLRFSVVLWVSCQARALFTAAFSANSFTGSGTGSSVLHLCLVERRGALAPHACPAAVLSNTLLR